MSIITTTLAATAITLSLGALAAPAASASPAPDATYSSTQAAPVRQGGGSVGICFTIPFPGSAALVWCL